MKNKTKYVSMYEITKIMHEGINDFEKDLKYQEWLKEMSSIENQIMDDMNKKIAIAMDKKTKEMYGIDIEKSMEETAQKMRHILENRLENFMQLPLKVYISYGKVWLFPSEEDEDEILYELHLSTDANTGILSIQYQGEDGSFLTHKQIVKALKMKNYI